MSELISRRNIITAGGAAILAGSKHGEASETPDQKINRGRELIVEGFLEKWPGFVLERNHQEVHRQLRMPSKQEEVVREVVLVSVHNAELTFGQVGVQVDHGAYGWR